MRKQCIDKPDPEACVKKLSDKEARYRQRHPNRVQNPPRKNEAGERWCSGYGMGGHFAPTENFHKSKQYADGIGSKCRECQTLFHKLPHIAARNRLHTWKRYGIVGMTTERYEDMLAEQKGRCYLCGAEPGKKQLALDHNHQTGMPRKLLCIQCNYSIERLENHDGWETRAKAYLKEYSA